MAISIKFENKRFDKKVTIEIPRSSELRVLTIKIGRKVLERSKHHVNIETSQTTPKIYVMLFILSYERKTKRKSN